MARTSVYIFGNTVHPIFNPVAHGNIKRGKVDFSPSQKGGYKIMQLWGWPLCTVDWQVIR